MVDAQSVLQPLGSGLKQGEETGISELPTRARGESLWAQWIVTIRGQELLGIGVRCY